MKRTIEFLTTCIVFLSMLTGCMKDREIAVYADFTTDKEVYELYEDVILTNTSYAENTRITSSKWEWDGKHIWGNQLDEPITFDRVGEHEIRLTVVSDEGPVSSTCVKTVMVQDTNKRPVADFTFEPATGIKAGDPVKFTDQSSDPDGQIVAWEWKFGSTVVTEQNPEFTFSEFGDITVSLTVEDNMRGKTTKTVVIPVAKSPYSLELIWKEAFENDPEAWIKFTSPATSPDGSVVYAFSSGYHLTAYSKDGNRLWSFDANKHNPGPWCNDGSKKGNTCTPSVDADGTIYIALAYNEKYQKTADYESGVYAINPNGTEKWYFPYGNARYIAVIPVIAGNDIILTTKANPTETLYPDLWNEYGPQDNGHVINKADGTFKQRLKVKRGNYGGGVAVSENIYVTHCDAKYGSRMFFKDSDGFWQFYGQDDNKCPKALGYHDGTLETGDSGQMAVGKDGRLYIIYENRSGIVDMKFNSVLYCYDPSTYVKDATTPFVPVWTAGINGRIARYDGVGVVIGEDGTLYVTTKSKDAFKSRVTAVSPDGQVKWEHEVEGDGEAGGEIGGSCAVDNEGYIYYNNDTVGKLVKISAQDGKKVAEIQLADSGLRSSPAISSDGTIYCVGMLKGAPTLFAVKGSATGHADSWSQLGGSPCRTGMLKK